MVLVTMKMFFVFSEGRWLTIHRYICSPIELWGLPANKVWEFQWVC